MHDPVSNDVNDQHECDDDAFFPKEVDVLLHESDKIGLLQKRI